MEYIKNSRKFVFNEDGSIAEGFINGKSLTEDDKLALTEYGKQINMKLTTLNEQLMELESQKKAIAEQQQELTQSYNKEFETIRSEMHDKIFSKYNYGVSSKEVAELKPTHIVWWMERWL